MIFIFKLVINLGKPANFNISNPNNISMVLQRDVTFLFVYKTRNIMVLALCK